MSNVEQLPAPRPALAAGAPVRAIVPQSMEEAFRIANAVVAAKLAPHGMDTPEACLIAIMQGMEVGLTPMQAIQRIAVINGRATIWGDAAMGLVRASGLCEYVKEWIEGEGDTMTAYCVVKRKGEREPIKGEFSVADAKRAGLWDRKNRDGSPGMYQRYPKRMLQMRARGYTLRDGFADVLGGLYLREELEGEPADLKDVTPAAAVEAPPAAAPTQEILPPEPQQKEPPKKRGRRRKDAVPYADMAAQASGQPNAPEGASGEPAEPFDPDKWLNGIEAAMAACKDQATLDEVWNEQVAPTIESGVVLPPDRDKAEDIYFKSISSLEIRGE